MLKYLSIGQIINVHGIKGEVKVYPLTDDINRFKKLKEIYLENGNTLIKYDVTSVKLLKNTAVLQLEGINTMEEALKLRDLYVKVDRAKAIKLPKDSFFICDLIDLTVYDVNGILLGILKDVIKTGSNDVFVVKSEDKKEILIPALKSVVKEINFEEGTIKIELPEGLI